MKLTKRQKAIQLQEARVRAERLILRRLRRRRRTLPRRPRIVPARGPFELLGFLADVFVSGVAEGWSKMTPAERSESIRLLLKARRRKNGDA